MLEDRQLMKMISQNDHSAFEVIYDRYWESLVKTAFNITQDQEVCYDAVQEIFISLWEKRKQVVIKELPGYLYGAVRLKMFEFLRNGKISQMHLDRMNSVLSSNNVEHFINHNELKNELDLSLAKLPVRCKEVFELSRFKYLSQAGIASKLNISPKTVEGHITRALKQLRSDLDRG